MNDIQKKTVFTVVLCLIGGALAVLAVPSSSVQASSGLIVDYGEYNIDYRASASGTNAVDALKEYATEKGYSITWNSDNTAPETVNGLPAAGSDTEWALYYTVPGALTWTKSTGDPTKLAVGNYSALCWGLCADGETPTRGVDASGVSFYGYSQKYAIVSMAPSITETICAVGNDRGIIGCDRFSNYPSYIPERMSAGVISNIGGYTDPSYEIVAQLGADLIIGIDSQSVHMSIIEKMRKNGTDCLVTYDGDSLDTILFNTYMVGVSMNYGIGATYAINSINSAIDNMRDMMSQSGGLVEDRSVMLALSAIKTPWIAGGDTYASDVIALAYCDNVFDDQSNWKQINSEKIVETNPDYILIVSGDGSMENTDAAYWSMMSGLSAEWKSTNAYKDGNIYVLLESAGDMASRPSTRVAQFNEIACRILQPDCFTDGITVPKHIGDDYTDYLYYTKTLGFNA